MQQITQKTTDSKIGCYSTLASIRNTYGQSYIERMWNVKELGGILYIKPSNLVSAYWNVDPQFCKYPVHAHLTILTSSPSYISTSQIQR